MSRSRVLPCLLAAVLLCSPAIGHAGELSVKQSPFGKTSAGEPVAAYTLHNSKGMSAKVITYGAALVELNVPDRHGKPADVVLGFDSLKGYGGYPYFGATIGRIAGRIAGGKFTLDGKEYKLSINNGPNSIHGGWRGFDQHLCTAETKVSLDRESVRLSFVSKDGDEGYPGNLKVSVTYSVTEKNELQIDYEASTDKPTIVNMTNHNYFNLAGAGSGSILNHELMIAADKYTPTDEWGVPTGALESVQGCPFDFCKPTRIGARIDQLSKASQGYDQNFVIRDGGKKLAFAARLIDPVSHRSMELWTTEPVLQLYTANFLDENTRGKGGAIYPRHSAVCLEPQHHQDAIHQPKFPSIVLRPGDVYKQTSVYRFGVK